MQLTPRSFMVGAGERSSLGKGERLSFTGAFWESPRKSTAASQLAHSWTVAVHRFLPTLGRDVPHVSDTVFVHLCPHTHSLLSHFQPCGAPRGGINRLSYPVSAGFSQQGALKGGVRGEQGKGLWFSAPFRWLRSFLSVIVFTALFLNTLYHLHRLNTRW